MEGNTQKEILHNRIISAVENFIDFYKTQCPRCYQMTMKERTSTPACPLKLFVYSVTLSRNISPAGPLP